MRRGSIPPTLSDAAAEAWSQSFLGAGTSSDAGVLLDGARELHVEAGGIVHRQMSGDPILVVVIEGLLRIYTSSPNGRQVTVRYVSPSDVVGLPSVLAPNVMGERLHLAVQAITDADLLRVPADRLLALIARNPSMTAPVFEELTRSLMSSYELLVENVFLPVRCRVARHFLDLAIRVDGDLMVRVSQQNIADSIASVREVVSRVILQMKEDGLIDRVRDGYLILAPEQLHRMSRLD